MTIHPIAPLKVEGLDEIVEDLLKGEPTPHHTPIPDGSKYILIPENNFHSYQHPSIAIAKETQYPNLKWQQAKTTLESSGHFMPSIPLFLELLTLLRSGNVLDCNHNRLSNQEITQILNNITEVRDPWRAEHLNAAFPAENKITYPIFSSGTLTYTTEDIAPDTLREDKLPGISLDAYLRNPTPQGLPRNNVSDSKLYYYHPKTGRVAGFNAGSNGAVLVCGGGPQFSVAELAVRPAKILV
jgi:hypothetical protein